MRWIINVLHLRKMRFFRGSGGAVSQEVTEYGDKDCTDRVTNIPSVKTLEKAADCGLVAAQGEVVTFKSLYWAEKHERRRVLFIFIRHFFCGVSSQAFCTAVFSADGNRTVKNSFVPSLSSSHRSCCRMTSRSLSLAAALLH